MQYYQPLEAPERSTMDRKFSLIPMFDEQLSSTARALIVEVAVMCDRERSNGQITFTNQSLRGLGCGRDRQICRAIAELRRKGILMRTRSGRGRLPWYAATWLPLDEQALAAASL